MLDAARQSLFLAGMLDRAEVQAIRFGDEGQRWEIMLVAAFLAHGSAMPEMQRRAGIVWAEIGVKTNASR